MSAPERKNVVGDKYGWVNGPKLPKLPAAIAGLMVGGTAYVETTGGVTLWVWFIQKSVLGQ